ncbi:hypothetical protein DFH09DRAFT_1325028 [Mycena vulgaris]|nr:hypothetical protein DFH09DRAFT_1325028 [Mycena vulgaris]
MPSRRTHSSDSDAIFSRQVHQLNEYSCDFSGCTNFKLKGAVMRRCSQCQTAYYCGDARQHAAWATHKVWCRAEVLRAKREQFFVKRNGIGAGVAADFDTWRCAMGPILFTWICVHGLAVFRDPTNIETQFVHLAVREFRYCAGTQCSATINFTGTEVHVIGAYRLNSGRFNVALDGVVYGPFGTATTVTEQFKIHLFNQTNLGPGTHSLTISNLPATDPQHPNLNLDYVRIHMTTFSYQPPNGWVSDLLRLNLPGFDVGTGHGTTQSGATATLNFMGDRVALYGPISSSGGELLRLGRQHQLCRLHGPAIPAGNHTVTVTTGRLTTQALVLSHAAVDGILNSIPRSTTSPAPKHAGIHREPTSGILKHVSVQDRAFVARTCRGTRKDISEQAALPPADSHVVPALNRDWAMEVQGSPASVPFTPNRAPPPGIKETQMMRQSLVDPPAYEADSWQATTTR